MILSSNKAVLHEVTNERRRHKSEMFQMKSSMAVAAQTNASTSAQVGTLLPLLFSEGVMGSIPHVSRVPVLSIYGAVFFFQVQELESQVKAYSDRCKATEQYVEMYRKQLENTEDEMFLCKEDFVKSEAAFELEKRKNEQVHHVG
jgi:hypothetical protein